MRKPVFGVALTTIFVLSGLAHAEKITVTIKNLQKPTGIYLTPVLMTTHNGSFMPFWVGLPAPESVERIAEDGDVEPLMMEALQSEAVSESMATMDGPVAPGETRTLTFEVDANDPSTQYLSFISMIIPSNDGFIANPHPMDIPLFDDDGNFIERVGMTAHIVYGDDVHDAGTEKNDEIPRHTAFLKQSTPDTGVSEDDVVRDHPGFMGSLKMGGGAKGNILKAYPQGDFTRPDSRVMSVSITKQ